MKSGCIMLVSPTSLLWVSWKVKTIFQVMNFWGFRYFKTPCQFRIILRHFPWAQQTTTLFRDADQVGFYEIKNNFWDSLTLWREHGDTLVWASLGREQEDNKNNAMILLTNLLPKCAFQPKYPFLILFF